MNKRDKHVRGAILTPNRAEAALDLRRYPPPTALEGVVTHLWFIDWDLEQPYIQSVLPFPAANWVCESDTWAVSGVQTRRYDRTLVGRGAVYGMLFQPTGLFSVWPRSQHTLTDQQVPLAPSPNQEAFSHLQSLESDTARVDYLVEQLHQVGIAPPTALQLELNRIVHDAKQRPEWTRVEQLAEQTGLGVRSLQRHFRKYIGISPKQMLRRFRLQEAAARLHPHTRIDTASLALELGYADQAHLIRDFKRIVGLTPERYRKSQIQRETP